MVFRKTLGQPSPLVTSKVCFGNTHSRKPRTCGLGIENRPECVWAVVGLEVQRGEYAESARPAGPAGHWPRPTPSGSEFKVNFTFHGEGWNRLFSSVMGGFYPQRVDKAHLSSNAPSVPRLKGEEPGKRLGQRGGGGGGSLAPHVTQGAGQVALQPEAPLGTKAFLTRLEGRARWSASPSVHAVSLRGELYFKPSGVGHGDALLRGAWGLS